MALFYLTNTMVRFSSLDIMYYCVIFGWGKINQRLHFMYFKYCSQHCSIIIIIIIVIIIIIIITALVYN